MSHETDKSASRSITLEITPSRMVMLDVRSDDDLATATAELKEVVVDELLDLGEASATDRLVETLRPLVREASLQGHGISVLLGGEYCTTRVIRGDEDAIRREMQELEKLKQHYMGLGRGEKALASVTRSIDAREETATVAIAVEATLEVLIEAAQALGIVLETVEPTAAALARLTGHLEIDQEQPIVVIVSDAAGTDIALMFEGELLVHHRLRAQLEADGEFERVRQQLCLMSQYSGRFSPIAREKSLPVYILDSTKVAAELESHLNQDSDLRLHRLSKNESLPGWHWNDEQGIDSVWPCVGGCLRAFLGQRAVPAPDLAHNLTSTSHLKIVAARRKMLFPLVAAGLIGVVLGSAAVWESTKAAQLRSNLERFESDEQKIEQMKLEFMSSQRFNTSTKAIGQQVSGIDWRRELRLLAQCRPKGVWLKRVALSQDGTLTITGNGDRDESVHEFQKWLDSAPAFRQVQVTSTRPGERTQFEMECKIRGRAGY